MYGSRFFHVLVPDLPCMNTAECAPWSCLRFRNAGQAGWLWAQSENYLFSSWSSQWCLSAWTWRPPWLFCRICQSYPRAEEQPLSRCSFPGRPPWQASRRWREHTPRQYPDCARWLVRCRTQPFRLYRLSPWCRIPWAIPCDISPRNPASCRPRQNHQCHSLSCIVSLPTGFRSWTCPSCGIWRDGACQTQLSQPVRHILRTGQAISAGWCRWGDDGYSPWLTCGNRELTRQIPSAFSVCCYVVQSYFVFLRCDQASMRWSNSSGQVAWFYS